MLAAIFRADGASGRVGASTMYLAYCRAAEPAAVLARLWGSFMASRLLRNSGVGACLPRLNIPRRILRCH
jgi:hypothetical protein